MSWRKWERAVEDGPGALGRRAVWFLVGFVVLGGAIGFFLNPLHQAARIVEKTVDADNVIANYEWFKRRHEDISAIDSKIRSARQAVERFAADAGPRESWHREDREEFSRLSVVALGLSQQRSDLAAEYNARSRMANRSIFKAGDVSLPESIPIEVQ